MTYIYVEKRTKNCPYCGKSFIPKHRNYCKAKFCSTSCRSKSHPSGRTGKINGEYQRIMVSLKTTGDQHFRWKGDGAGYEAIHSWVERRMGKPHICEYCGRYVENLKFIHWANIDHKYRRNLDDFIRLCIKCHGRYDKALGLRKHKLYYSVLKS